MARPSLADVMKGGMGVKDSSPSLSLNDDAGDPHQDAFDAFADAMASKDRAGAMKALETFIGLCGSSEPDMDDE